MRIRAALAAATLAFVATTGAFGATSADAGTATAAKTHFKIVRVSTPDGKSHVVRWDPCQAIDYRVNVAGLPKAGRTEALGEVKKIAARLSAATGMTFHYQGPTTFIPKPGNYTDQPAELVVAFVTPQQTSYPLGGLTAGYGGVGYQTVSEADGSYKLAVTSGYVVIDRVQTLGWPHSMTAPGTTRPNLLAHELGHAVGLQHVDDVTQTMHGLLNAKTPGGRYGVGDLAGLRKVGRPAGCLNFPTTG